MSEVYDVIVVGAGVEGSATARNLCSRGKRVLLLEQFPLPHTRGSSHGQTRITRKAYPESFYTAMMHFCTLEWKRLEQESGNNLLKQIGYLAIGDVNGEFIHDNVSSMTRHGAPYTLLTPTVFRETYPMLHYPNAVGGVFDPDGGTLMADKAVMALQGSFMKMGGTLRDGEKFLSLTPGDIITVTTNKGDHRGKAVVFACGPWTNSVLAHLNLKLPLQAVRINVCYWPERVEGSHSSCHLPTFFDFKCCGGHSIFGLPSEEYPGHVKLCLHHGPDIQPEAPDVPSTGWVVGLLQDYVRRHFPGLMPEPSVVESCIYTNTPDRHFILDRHPRWENIVFGAGFSGHGFKLAPAIGQLLGDLALGESSQFDISPFRLSRFDKLPGPRL